MSTAQDVSSGIANPFAPIGALNGGASNGVGSNWANNPFPDATPSSFDGTGDDFGSWLHQAVGTAQSAVSLPAAAQTDAPSAPSSYQQPAVLSPGSPDGTASLSSSTGTGTPASGTTNVTQNTVTRDGGTSSVSAWAQSNVGAVAPGSDAQLTATNTASLPTDGASTRSPPALNPAPTNPTTLSAPAGLSSTPDKLPAGALQTAVTTAALRADVVARAYAMAAGQSVAGQTPLALSGSQSAGTTGTAPPQGTQAGDAQSIATDTPTPPLPSGLTSPAVAGQASTTAAANGPNPNPLVTSLGASATPVAGQARRTKDATTPQDAGNSVEAGVAAIGMLGQFGALVTVAPTANGPDTAVAVTSLASGALAPTTAMSTAPAAAGPTPPDPTQPSGLAASESLTAAADQRGSGPSAATQIVPPTAPNSSSAATSLLSPDLPPQAARTNTNLALNPDVLGAAPAAPAAAVTSGSTAPLAEPAVGASPQATSADGATPLPPTAAPNTMLEPAAVPSLLEAATLAAVGAAASSAGPVSAAPPARAASQAGSGAIAAGTLPVASSAASTPAASPSSSSPQSASTPAAPAPSAAQNIPWAPAGASSDTGTQPTASSTASIRGRPAAIDASNNAVTNSGTSEMPAAVAASANNAVPTSAPVGAPTPATIAALPPSDTGPAVPTAHAMANAAANPMTNPMANAVANALPPANSSAPNTAGTAGTEPSVHSSSPVATAPASAAPPSSTAAGLMEAALGNGGAPPPLAVGPSSATASPAIGGNDIATSGEPGATPAAQIASALVAFSANGTSNVVTVQLQPAELGRVQISVTSDATGLSSVQVSADRPETLALLQNDQPELAKALDQAGIASAGRTVSFQLSGELANGASTNTQVGTQVGTQIAGPGATLPGLDATHSAGDPLGGGSAASAPPLAGALGNTNAAPNSVASAESGFANALSGAPSNPSGGGSGFYHPPPQPGSAQAGNPSFGGQSGSGGQSGGGRTDRQSWGDNSDLLFNDAADLINEVGSGWMSNGLDIIA